MIPHVSPHRFGKLTIDAQSFRDKGFQPSIGQALEQVRRGRAELIDRLERRGCHFRIHTQTPRESFEAGDLAEELFRQAEAHGIADWPVLSVDVLRNPEPEKPFSRQDYRLNLPIEKPRLMPPVHVRDLLDAVLHQVDGIAPDRLKDPETRWQTLHCKIKELLQPSETPSSHQN